MGLEKYRADEQGTPDKNGAIPWYTRWMGGPTLALIKNCPTPYGPRTVYITGEADTFFSIPAVCTYKGKVIRGWVGMEDEAYQFHENNGAHT